MDDLRYLRDRQASLIAQLDRWDNHAHDPTAVLVGKVFDNGHLPTTPGNYFAVHPVTVGGTEAEGSAGTFSVNAAATVFFLVIGSKAPIAGDVLIARSIDGRWVAEWGSKTTTGTVTVPGCPCTATPASLNMTSSSPQSNFGIFQSATFQYGPTPPEYGTLGLGASSYLSTRTFTDQVSSQPFRYYLSCLQGRYVLTRVYSTPFRDIVRYTWQIGLQGNTCTPFRLLQGQVYQGGDPSCVVSVTG
jgi:hypothetical protein